MKNFFKLFLLVALYFIGSIMFFVTKYALISTQPIFLNGIRCLLASLILLPFVFPQLKKNAANLWFNDKKLFLRFTLIGFFFSYIALTLALKYISVVASSLLLNLSPFITAILAYVSLNHRMTRWKLLGIIIGFVGFIFTLAGNFTKDTFSELIQIKGIIIMLLGTIAACYAWVDLKKLIHKGYSFLGLNTMAMGITSILCLPISLIFEPWPLIHISLKSIFAIAVLTLLGNILYNNLYGYLLKTYTPTFVALAAFLTSLFSILINHFYFEKAINWDFFASFILIVIGMIIFYKQEIKQGYIVHH